MMVIQKPNALSRGNATSRAPIIRGTKYIENPSSDGTTTRKIIVVPCMVKI